MRQLSPKKRKKIPISNIHQLFCLFYKKPEQYATPKDILPSAKRLLPFGFVLL
jgi:hypothetical protein